MSSTSSYLIDSDVLITAKNQYYAFPICPVFWDSILHGHSLGCIYSIDQVKLELLRGRSDDDLVQWINRSVPAGFFLGSDNDEVVTAFIRVMHWVTRRTQYHDEAKVKFARGADGWLVAHGVTSGKTVVTNEQPRPESRKVIKLPDVCNAFSVNFDMLHTLGVQYRFSSGL